MSWAFGHYVVLAWLPTYYSQAYGLNVGESAALTVVPWVATFMCTNVAGWTADRLINDKILTTTQTRKLMNSISMFIPAASLTFLSSGKLAAAPLPRRMPLLAGQALPNLSWEFSSPFPLGAQMPGRTWTSEWPSASLR